MATHVMNTEGMARTGGRVSTTPTLLGRLETFGRRLLDAWAWYDKYRQTVRELNGLSDRELDDIGIPRYEIPTIAMRSANDATERR